LLGARHGRRARLREAFGRLVGLVEDFGEQLQRRETEQVDRFEADVRILRREVIVVVREIVRVRDLERRPVRREQAAQLVRVALPRALTHHPVDDVGGAARHAERGLVTRAVFQQHVCGEGARVR
jgi:hypothetical protein